MYESLSRKLAETMALELKMLSDGEDFEEKRLEIIERAFAGVVRHCAEYVEDYAVMEDLPTMTPSECLGHNMAQGLRAMIGDAVHDGPPCMRKDRVGRKQTVA